MVKIKTVIFDWSGVLSNDWVATVITANDVLEEWGHPRISEKKFKELYELPWTRFYEKLGIEINKEKECLLWGKHFPKYMHLVKPFPKAKETLKWLKGKSIKTIVLSAQNIELIEKEIQDYGFQNLIHAVDGNNTDKRKKIEKLVKEHEIEKKTSIYVGDMCHDVETAKFAGITSVAVLSGYDCKEKLEKAGADYIIRDVGELPALIEKLEAEND